MVALVAGYRTTSDDVAVKLQSIPDDLREGLITGVTDFDEFVIGYVLLDMGPFGVDSVCGLLSVDLIRNAQELGIILGLDDLSIAEVLTLDLT